LSVCIEGKQTMYIVASEREMVSFPSNKIHLMLFSASLTPTRTRRPEKN